jgi:hypothetical protein
MSPFGATAKNRAPPTRATTSTATFSGTFNFRETSNGLQRILAGTETVVGTRSHWAEATETTLATIASPTILQKLQANINYQTPTHF